MKTIGFILGVSFLGYIGYSVYMRSKEYSDFLTDHPDINEANNQYFLSKMKIDQGNRSFASLGETRSEAGLGSIIVSAILGGDY